MMEPSPGLTKTPEELAASGWKKTRAGLCWVLLGLFFLVIPGVVGLPGYVGFGKIVYTRATQQELPTGKGWIEIPGYVNTDDAPIQMTKIEQLDVALFGFPILLAGLCLTIGRLKCRAAPRNSGARGMFFCSGVFTMLALVALVMAAICDRYKPYDRDFQVRYYYFGLGFLVTVSLAEFWFLTSLTACGATLKRPRTARAVGVLGFVVALTALVPTVGLPFYYDYDHLRPKGADLTADWKLYEQSAVMIGWLLVIGVYWCLSAPSASPSASSWPRWKPDTLQPMKPKAHGQPSVGFFSAA